MPKINTSPLSGTRDFLPIDVLRRRYVVGIVEDVYQSFGFEPLETPVMERLETLLGKYGEEGDQLIFRVLKRGEKLQRALQEDPRENHLSDAGLRYDLTVPLARVAAEYQAQLPKVFKRYQIQPVFRADRPAKGRFREFFQCDLDVVGSSSPVVEAEVLAAAAEVLRRLGFGAPCWRRPGYRRTWRRQLWWLWTSWTKSMRRASSGSCGSVASRLRRPPACCASWPMPRPATRAGSTGWRTGFRTVKLRARQSRS
jgi:hypothetical protein